MEELTGPELTQITLTPALKLALSYIKDRSVNRRLTPSRGSSACLGLQEDSQTTSVLHDFREDLMRSLKQPVTLLGATENPTNVRHRGPLYCCFKENAQSRLFETILALDGKLRVRQPLIRAD